ncbi:MAG TPA: glycerophosphodiester phosphodiesterase family protein, partial [Xanthobacteraceae bacterium]|nr:glycerophosphodiester phosphodiesterase family protein [Xanthobacteraceae bacterium]
ETADGEAMVHHDAALGRLTEDTAHLATMTAAALKQIAFKVADERMITLGELCELVAGRVPLIVELKSRYEADITLVRRVVEVLRGYAGPVAVMSFDPRQVRALRALAPGLPRGIVAQRRYDHPEWERLSPAQRRSMTHLLHAFSTQPHFVAYRVQDLPAPAPQLARYFFGLPLLTWTVRTPEERARAARWASQMIFEGFKP